MSDSIGSAARRVPSFYSRSTLSLAAGILLDWRRDSRNSAATCRWFETADWALRYFRAPADPARCWSPLRSAVCLLIVTSSGLFLRTVQKLETVDIGFERDHLLLFTVRPGLNGYKEERLGTYYTKLQQSIRISSRGACRRVLDATADRCGTGQLPAGSSMDTPPPDKSRSTF